LKKLIIFTFICVILCISIAYGSFDNNFTAKDPLVKKDFEINGVQLGMEISEVPKILGNPIKIETTKKKTITYYYKEFSITSFYYIGVKKRTVDYILIKTNEYSTYRGIKIGSSEKDVILRYGEPRINRDTILYYQIKDDNLNTYVIEFLVEKGKIKQIEIYMPED
jgi:hypothetical protein